MSAVSPQVDPVQEATPLYVPELQVMLLQVMPATLRVICIVLKIRLPCLSAGGSVAPGTLATAASARQAPAPHARRVSHAFPTQRISTHSWPDFEYLQSVPSGTALPWSHMLSTAVAPDGTDGTTQEEAVGSHFVYWSQNVPMPGTATHVVVTQLCPDFDQVHTCPRATVFPAPALQGDSTAVIPEIKSRDPSRHVPAVHW